MKILIFHNKQTRVQHTQGLQGNMFIDLPDTRLQSNMFIDLPDTHEYDVI